MDGASISEGIICEKVLCIYADLLKEIPSTSAEGECRFIFKASRGRLETFIHRTGIHSFVWHGEVASSSMEAAKMYVGEFLDFVNAGGYLPQQVFN